MNIITFVGAGIIMCILIVTLKQIKPELALLLSICSMIALTAAIISAVIPLLDELKGMAEGSGLDSELILVAIKAVGICVVVQIASDVCRDAGQSSLAAKLEIGGKVSLLIVALPIYKQMLALAADIMGGKA